jgi:adenylate kinase
MEPLNLIIVGPQGSGKTSQARLLAKTFRFGVVGAGDVLREIAKQDTELGRRISRSVNEGRLVEPELISEVIEEKIAAVPKEQGLILEGYPRTLTQYALFKKFWAKSGRGDYRLVFIELSEEDAIKRLTRRVTCEDCGAVPIQGRMEKCSECGGRLMRRPDDTPGTIRTRLQAFYSETMPMIRAMESDGKVLHIDGAVPVDDVYREIVAKLR